MAEIESFLDQQLLTREDAAKLLNISMSGLDNLISGRAKSKPLPAVRIGRRVFLRPEAIRAWLDDLEKQHELPD